MLRSAADRLPLGAAAEWLTGPRMANPVLTGVLLAVTLVAAAFVLLRVLSVAWFLLQLHGFTLTRRGSDLRADYGLFTRVRRTIPTRRIQSLTAAESPLHRWFRRQSLELRTVGGGASTDDDVDLDPSSDGGKAESQWLAPMVETAQVPHLLRQVLPEVDLAGVAWRRLAAGARRRVLVRGLAVAAALTLLATLPAGPWGLALAPPRRSPLFCTPIAGWRTPRGRSPRGGCCSGRAGGPAGWPSCPSPASRRWGSASRPSTAVTTWPRSASTPPAVRPAATPLRSRTLKKPSPPTLPGVSTPRPAGASSVGERPGRPSLAIPSGDGDPPAHSSWSAVRGSTRAARRAGR